MIWLSAAQATVLADGLDVPVRQFPFQFPGDSPLVEDQQRQAAAVADELAGRGLFRRGALDPDLERALFLLDEWSHAIAVLGTVERDREIYARLHTDGECAALLVQSGGELGIELVDPHRFCATAVDLLGEHEAARGQSITVYGGDHERSGFPVGGVDEDEDELLVPAFGGRGGSQNDRASAILARERSGVGYLVPIWMGRDGRPAEGSAVTWMDTDLGRYMVTGGTADGRAWATYTPATGDRIRRHLEHELFEVDGSW